ncbi:uncharacterized protein LOC110183255 [Drosophila serrata]|uniref:uncharacterized protein LOC110183255 n=1 Tax=Drosophila serrata TaxID=7274 RepID=UPI000A1CFC79|nr:uncharacterized protein LOC110183255 [Drosophila serrata]
MAILPLGEAIVGAGRDLLLTPRQGHQLNGKRIYYEEEKEEELLRRRSPSEQRLQRPWERTLKHVTYVTLFTDAAVNAAAGNLSQLHEYHDFLQTPYLPTDPQSGSVSGSASSRFGDIITLAKGYLEQLGTGQSNATYRFVEGGTCFQLKCPGSSPNQRRRALWQVQRIRHRDGESGGRPFHYEMKFSVTPLESQSWQPNQPMSYIQKESDYPGSFGRFTREPGFAQRRQDRPSANAEQSQATFVHGIFQPAPSLPLPPALPPKLNIGEYLKGSPKIELFPGLFNLGLRPNYVAPTTFRPNYPAVERFPHSHNNNNELPGVHGGGEASPGGVTHHFHHHFYVAPGTGDTELAYRLPSSSSSDNSELTTPPSHPIASFYPPHQTVQFPSSHSASSESVEDQRGEQEHEQEQAVLLRTPQIYGQASKYQTAKLPPLLIYAGANDEDKSFVQSEPLEETVYRYSEPDPLYLHQNPIDVLPEKQHDQEQQLEVNTEQEKKGSSLEQPELVTTAAPGTTTEATEASSISTTTATTLHVIPTTSSSNFVSTSTHFSPLRSISRYRTTPRITAGRSTTTTTSTTTEPPISKWAKRRKDQDNKGKGSLRHEAFIAAGSTTTTTTTTTTTEAATPPPRPVVEVLTQKSVSRSVSIKVGENGEEIPILVDDEENEVKPIAIK